MTENRQPFTDYVSKANRRPGAARWGWIVAGVLAALLVAAVWLWAVAAGKARGLEPLRTELDDANARLAAVQNVIQTNQDLIASLRSQIADLQAEKEMAARMSQGLENEMRADLESRDVTISNLQGRLTVNILDRVLFDSGEAILKPDGETVMRKVAGLLTEHPDLRIQVIGHTDNVPIRPEARSRFASNWELSTGRALAAVHFLTEKAGLDPRRVGAVGYGEFRPIADNATPEGRAKNRRIEIAIMPGVVLVPAPAPAAVPVPPPVSTNSPPGSATDPSPPAA